MSAALIAAPVDLYHESRRHLGEQVEQVGFFLAGYQERRRAFVLREWRPILPEGFEIQSPCHLTLRDDVGPEIIRAAWKEGACLVEVHSHCDDGIACFSPSDISGLADWVPHLWWRLRGRPYAAIVTAGDTFDALAWIESADQLEQIEQIEVGGVVHLASCETVRRLSLTKGVGRC